MLGTCTRKGKITRTVTMNDNDLEGFTLCVDGLTCFHGSLCTENPEDEGTYYCDCDESSLDDAVSGLMCEHVATEYCTYNQEFSMISFCTNNGTCKAKVGVEDAHLGCNCPPEYEGTHCQFVKGSTRPNNWPGGEGNISSAMSSSGDKKLSGGVTAVIVLIVLGFVGFLGYFVYMKRKPRSSSSGFSSPEFALEADGEVLKRAVQSGVHNNGSGGMGSPEFELDADGEVLKEAIRSGSGIPLSPSTAATMEDFDVASPASATEDQENGEDENGDMNGGIV